MKRTLVPAGVVLRRHENEPWAAFGGAMLRRAATYIQNANDCDISRQNADANRGGYGEAENQRHEERNHSQPTLISAVFRCRQPGFRLRSFFNLPALSRAASDDSGAPQLGAP